MIVLDGVLHDGPTVPFDPSDRGLLLADGLFETCAVVGGVVFRREAHVERMLDGARRLALPIDRARIEATLEAALAPLGSAASVLRLTLTRGPGARGLSLPEDPRPTLMATSSPWNRDLVGRPARLATSTIRRNETSPTSRLKSLAYLDAILAMAEARAAGADDALMLDTTGRVACTTMANVFVRFGDRLVTPPGRDGVLAGTTRGLLLAEGAGLGFDCREASLTPEDLAVADEVFLTNAVRLVVPVISIDGRAFGDGSAASRALEGLRGAILAECGVDPLA